MKTLRGITHETRQIVVLRSAKERTIAERWPTLFSRVPGASPLFAEVLKQFYDDKPCPRTLELLNRT